MNFIKIFLFLNLKDIFKMIKYLNFKRIIKIKIFSTIKFSFKLIEKKNNSK
jgi:hypothetical protein